MNILVLATRISGNDGVSLEAKHWKDILSKMGHKVTFIAGQLDQAGIVIPELHFQSSDVVDIYNRVVFGNENFRKVEKDIFTLSGKIEGSLREVFNNGRKVDCLIVPNIFSLPMHIPLAVSLARIIEEKRIPTIARHHDFWWERERFRISHMGEFFERWFPPKLPSLKHVVINSIAQKQLRERTGIKAEVIWDSFNFDSGLDKSDSFSKNFRQDFLLNEYDTIFLQATRIIPRKRIELSIELVKQLKNPKIVLVIAGHEGDEGGGYLKKLKTKAKASQIRAVFADKRINSKRKIIGGKRIYTLWDAYRNCDFMTYPSRIEGFGNQFVEAVYFKKPVIITPYPVFEKDIKPLGFKTIKIGEKITQKTAKKVNSYLNSPGKIAKMTEKNFKLGEKYLSYNWVERKLEKLLKFG